MVPFLALPSWERLEIGRLTRSQLAPGAGRSKAPSRPRGGIHERWRGPRANTAEHGLIRANVHTITLEEAPRRESSGRRS